MPNFTAGLTRRAATAWLAVVPALVLARAACAANVPKITVTKDPDCSCCGRWIAHLNASGFDATVSESADLNKVKSRLGVPDELASCHTAEVEGYVIEGHVPAVAIRRLLAERPEARGLAVPGMPTGAPGMEAAGSAPQRYDVVLFGPFGRRIFARFEGTRELRD